MSNFIFIYLSFAFLAAAVGNEKNPTKCINDVMCTEMCSFRVSDMYPHEALVHIAAT